jgi:hypothetical protein
MRYAIAVIAAVFIGFTAGLLTYRQSRRWCPACGTTLTCRSCGFRPVVAEPGTPVPAERTAGAADQA